jgi:hypothetical protein
MRRLALTLAATLALVGVGRSGSQAATPEPTGTSTAVQHSVPQPMLGVDLYAAHNYSAATVRADGRRTLSYIKNVLKARTVGIVWDFYAATPQANTVQTTGATLSAANVAILTRLALSDHLQVEYRPLIMVKTGAENHWEGKIYPVSPAQWFDSYYHAELPYLRVAQQYGVGEFVTATEMAKLSTNPLWPTFFARIGRVYHGTISFSAWDKSYFSNPGTIPPLRYIGFDDYWALNLRYDATYPQVLAAWEEPFSRLPAALLERTAIDETGIQARKGAYANPPQMEVPGVLDEQVQAYWIRAACATVHRFHLRGVFFWKVDLTDNPAHPARSLSTFEGKQGAGAIRMCAG